MAALEIGLLREGDFAQFTIRDTGIGITSEVLPHLFTMFFQANQSSQTVKTGLGVGLALAKILVVMHGGTIDGQSEREGKGAKFIVRTPIAERVEEPRRVFKELLVVDDNPDHLELLADLTELQGYDVIKAPDAAEALRVSRRADARRLRD